MNQELMSKDLTIEYNQLEEEIVIKDAGHIVERITSERVNQFGYPIFDIRNWNGSCTISRTMRGDHFNLFLKLNDKYYKSFQRIDEDRDFEIFRNFNEVEKINGKWERIN